MSFFNALVYFCGFVGCAAISFAPLRSFELIAVVVKGNFSETARKRLLAIALLANLAVLLYEIRVLLRLYHCMTSASCPSPGIRMWMYLTLFGVVYLGFEAIFFAIRRYARAQPSPSESGAQARR